MSRVSIFYKLLAAVGVILGPLFFMPLPSVAFPPPYETAPENFRALAEGASGPILLPLLVQLLGAVLIVPGALGIMHILLTRKRALLVGHLGGGLTLLGAFSAMTVIGMEVVQYFILANGPDLESNIALALAINEDPTFGIFLLTALMGIFVGLILLVVSLWRAGFIPVWTIALFVLPIAVGLLPLPGQAVNFIRAAGISAPFVWIGWLMLRMPGAVWQGEPSLLQANA